MFSHNLMEVRFEGSYRIRQGLEGTVSAELWVRGQEAGLDRNCWNCHHLNQFFIPLAQRENCQGCGGQLGKV